jgi:hypothetical protein
MFFRIAVCQTVNSVQICADMRSRVVIPAILLLAVFQSALATVQLIQNGGFESTSAAPWVLQGTGVAIGNAPGYAASGSQYLAMGYVNGAQGAAYQIITFPTNLIAATLSFDYDTISQDTSGSDSVEVYITNTNQPPGTLVNVGFLSNAYPSPNSAYQVVSVNVVPYAGQGALSTYAGQTVEVYFYLTTDPNYGSLTAFNIDNVSLLAATTADIPPNVHFADATLIPEGGTTDDLNTTYAFKETGEPNIADNVGGHSVWWTWTAPAIGIVNISTAGSGFDTLLGVFTGSSLTNLTVVTSDNGANASSGRASVKFVAVPGTQYQIALDGYDGQAGNAVFTFTFTMDKTPPKVSFSSPAADTVLTNSSVLVEGKASDNVAVASVQYRVENSTGTNAWQLAATSNQWTNWSATVTNLIPGPNTVTLEAIDTSSNVSALVSRVFDYDLGAVLTLNTNGRGTISGATNGQSLNLGFPYKITAKPAAGFAFTGWTGSLITNRSSLSFTMASNLHFTANFLDVETPTLAITAPASGLRWSNSLFRITGKAADLVAVSNVWVQFNAAPWTTNVTSTNQFANWYTEVTLTSGDQTISTNTIKAYAVDIAGNHSLTNTVRFFYIQSDRPKVSITGLGTISPNYSNVLLQLGSHLTMTAKPGKGYLFSNWISGTGADLTNGPALKFIMASNLDFTANFIPNPFLPAAGTYQGLFYDTNATLPVPAGSGFFSAQVANDGSFTAKFLQGGATHSLSGRFSLLGAWSAKLLPAWSGVAVSLTLDLTGANALTGGLTNAGWTSELDARRVVFSAANPAPQAGKYTLVLPGTNSPGLPGGAGFGSVAVQPDGAVTLSGHLGDGTKVTPSATVSAQRQWPLYISLDSGNGLLMGWLTFTNEPDRDLDGLLHWLKPSHPGTPFYPAGFTNQIQAAGSAYLFATGARVLDLTNGFVLLENGGLPQPISNFFVLGANNKATGSNKLSLTFTTATGLFQGSATNADGKSLSFSGAVLQKQTNGFGLFLDAPQTGGVSLAPR